MPRRQREAARGKENLVRSALLRKSGARLRRRVTESVRGATRGGQGRVRRRKSKLGSRRRRR
jgi:hypothetical protein